MPENKLTEDLSDAYNRYMEAHYQEMVEQIKRRVCPFATYQKHGIETLIPKCDRGVNSCPRPEICTDCHSGCMGIHAYYEGCGKIPGKPCPKNICIIQQTEWQIERNRSKLLNSMKRYEKTKEGKNATGEI